MQDLTVSQLEVLLSAKKAERKANWARIGNCPSVAVFDTFISYTCSNELEVKNVLNSMQPYGMMDEVKGSGKNSYTDRPTQYRVVAKNGYYDRTLQIVFKLRELEVHVKIDTKFLSQEIKDLFSFGTRGLYDSETVYVNTPSHYKKFKDIRIPSFGFGNYETVRWYGGDVTLLSVDKIDEIINHFKSYQS
jgi:hypothetical protein